MHSNQIFVYGTLRLPGGLLSDSTFLCDARLLGYALYGTEADFPFIVKVDDSYSVVGECFAVTDQILRYLDSYEGYRAEDPDGSLFTRERATVSHGAQESEVWVYVGGQRLQNEYFSPQLIESGDWFNRERRR